MNRINPDSAEVAYDQFVAAIYRGCAFVPADAFQEWALLQLRELIPFDAALWGSGRRETMRFHSQTMLGLDSRYTLTLEQTTAINPIWRALLAQPEEPVDSAETVPDDEFYASDIYHQCFARFGIERLLATLHRDPRSGLLSLLSIYRKDRSQRFSVQEKQLARRAVQHLVNAASHAFFTHLIRTAPDASAHAPAAICDASGYLYEVQPQFLDLLEEHFPNWHGSKLPFPLDPETRLSSHNGIRCTIEPFMDLLCVQIWQEGPLDKLTEREREVVQEVCKGLSFKAIARKTGIAPSTVSNHLYRIYRKLGIRNRSSLVTLLEEELQHGQQ